MTPAKIVVDTNVYVSALIKPSGICGEVVALITKNRQNLLYDNRMISEYKEVLGREKFGFDKKDVSGLIDMIKNTGTKVYPFFIDKIFTDETDKKFYEVFLGGNADFLITGNKKHFPESNKIISPAEYLSLFT